LMRILDIDPNDRDSLVYREKIRPLEYKYLKMQAADFLKLGVHVVLPAPWTDALESGDLFSNAAMGFPDNTIIKRVYLYCSLRARHGRILKRGSPRDKWKLEHWDEYIASINTGWPDVDPLLMPVLNTERPMQDILADVENYLDMPSRPKAGTVRATRPGAGCG
jgi:hypothetical protein